MDQQKLKALIGRVLRAQSKIITVKKQEWQRSFWRNKKVGVEYKYRAIPETEFDRVVTHLADSITALAKLDSEKSKLTTEQPQDQMMSLSAEAIDTLFVLKYSSKDLMNIKVPAHLKTTEEQVRYALVQLGGGNGRI